MGDSIDAATAGHLRAFIERIERLEEEKKQLSEDIKEVYAEAKGNGFDPKIMRKIVAERKIDASKRAEEETMLDLYRNALGMLADTPLGTAATERVIEEARRPKAKAPKGGLKAQIKDKLLSTFGAGGKPVPLTDDEKRKGMSVAFERAGGERVTMGFDAPVSAA